jgi:hypothetical protein
MYAGTDRATSHTACMNNVACTFHPATHRQNSHLTARSIDSNTSFRYHGSMEECFVIWRNDDTQYSYSYKLNLP